MLWGLSNPTISKQMTSAKKRTLRVARLMAVFRLEKRAIVVAGRSPWFTVRRVHPHP